MNSRWTSGGAGTPTRVRCSARSTTRSGARPRTTRCTCCGPCPRRRSRRPRRDARFVERYDRAIAGLDAARHASNTWWSRTFPEIDAALDRVFLRRVRAAPVAADLRRRPGRARGRSLQGSQRPRRAAHRRRVHVPAGILSPASHRRRLAAGELRKAELGRRADRAGDDGRRVPCWCRCRSAIGRCSCRSGASISAARSSICWTRISRKTRRGTGSSPPASTAATARCASSRRSCSASAASAPFERSGRTRPCITSTKATPGSSSCSGSASRSIADASFDEALAEVRRTTVFTTHTPVPAGHDAFPFHLVEQHLASAWGPLGEHRGRFLALGEYDNGDGLAVQHDGARAAIVGRRQRGQPAARRGDARDVGADLAGHRARERAGRRTHQRRARADVDVHGHLTALREILGPGLGRPPRRPRLLGQA